MQFTALSLSVFAAAAAASPCYPETPEPSASSGATAGSGKFTIQALRSASDIHFAPFSAAQNSLFLRLPDQKASCDKETNSATFYIQDGGLYLYAASATPQQIYVDRSGMGQGKVGYTTGAEPAPRNGERTGWVIDDAGNLTLDGAGFLACPGSIDDAWSIWVSAGVEKPAGQEGCLGFSARTVEADEPISCLYTQQGQE
ncbi:hypothetical protein B0T11DRAFT_321635 [Plectosphaerella cucumerina]|uniref:Cell wall protein PhiA n=1 Tax=Plectosphaerella cucumerina TaxID=40658 RepID=A0A8K0TAJ4_9PEZI|nr:hypothetical protein B0T11DRAFT_321635 [Plectosphaerella cucumerina]